MVNNYHNMSNVRMSEQFSKQGRKSITSGGSQSSKSKLIFSSQDHAQIRHLGNAMKERLAYFRMKK